MERNERRKLSRRKMTETERNSGWYISEGVDEEKEE